MSASELQEHEKRWKKLNEIKDQDAEEKKESEEKQYQRPRDKYREWLKKQAEQGNDQQLNKKNEVSQNKYVQRGKGPEEETKAPLNIFEPPQKMWQSLKSS